MCAQDRDWTLRGKRIHMCPVEVERKLLGASLGPVRQYYVEVGGKRHALKPAFGLVTGEPAAGFTTQDAYRMFQGVGLRVGSL